jgi:hypothetical protein
LISDVDTTTLIVLLPHANLNTKKIVEESIRTEIVNPVFDFRVHNVRIVSVMKAQEISKLLTVDAKDFGRCADIIAIQSKDIP